MLRKSTHKDDDESNNNTSHHHRHQQQQPKLNFYLHVGPTKTGSTTIQENIGIHHKDLLKEKDHWVMHKFRPNTVELTNCLYEYHSPCKQEYLNDFRTFLRICAENNHHIILSWESMWDRLYEAIPIFRQEVEEENGGGFQLSVVVVYRRLYEWLKSRFYQDHRFSCPNVTHARWSGELIQERLSPIPFLSEFMTNETNSLASTTRTRTTSSSEGDHPAAIAMRDGKIFAQNVILFNLHGGDVMQRFYCLVLRAKHTCAAFSRNANITTTVVANEGHSLFYERFAQQAILRGFVATTNNCTETTNKILLYQESNNRTMLDLPLLCPSHDILGTLLVKTLESENLLFPQEAHTFDLQMLRNEFEQEHDGESSAYFCDADVDKIFEDTEWKQFFKSLGG